MPDEFTTDFMELLTKYCGDQWDYNWDSYDDGKKYLRLTMKFKQRYTDYDMEIKDDICRR